MTYRPNRRVEIAARVAFVITMMFVPGIFTIDLGDYWHAASKVGLHNLPYRGFLWEFPPVTAVVPIAGRLMGHDLFVLVLPLSMMLCEYVSLSVIRRAYSERAAAITAWWTLLCIPLATVAYFRLDFLAVLPACLVLAAWRRERSGTAGIVVGALTKLWPGAMVAGLLAERAWKRAALAMVWMAACVAAWWRFSPSGFATFLSYRKGSGVQIESMVGSVLHLTSRSSHFVSGAWVVGAGGWGWVDQLGMLALGGFIAAVALIAWRYPGRTFDRDAVVTAVVAISVISSRLLSPQYLVWLLPFAALAAARGDRRTGTRFLAAGVLTVIDVAFYRALVHGSPLIAGVVLARNTVLLMLTVDLVRRAFRPAPSPVSPAPEQSELVAS